MSSQARSLRRERLAAMAVAVVAMIPLVGANSASAANNFGAPYDVFNYCPVDDPRMLGAFNEAACIAAVAEGGSIKLGKIQTTLGPQTTSMAIFDTPQNPGVPKTIGALNGKTVNARPARVPGGMLGLVCKGDPGNVITQICKTIENNGLNRVTATAVSAGRPQFALTPGPTVPIKLRLNNPLLGDNCYIGSNADPIVLNLLLGTTPETGFELMPAIPGFESLVLLNLTNVTFDDTAFTVPKATGCGLLGLFNGAINSRAGLPSPSGNNAIHLDADVFVADAFQGGGTPGQFLSDALHSTE